MALPFTKTLTLTATPTKITDLIAGVTDGSGPAMGFRGNLLIAGGTVALSSTSGSANLPTGSNIPLTSVNLQDLLLAGNTFTATLVGIQVPGYA